MSGLSDKANITITLLFILGVGYLIYRIDRRVRREGPLVTGDGSRKSRRYALVIGSLLSAFVILEWYVGIRIMLFFALSIALLGYGLGFDHFLEIFQPKPPALAMAQIRGIEWMSPGEIEMQVQAGARFLAFEYCVSFFSRTRIFQSRIYFIKPKESFANKIVYFCLVSIIMGWSNPFKLYKTLRTNISGGMNVTDRVLLLSQRN